MDYLPAGLCFFGCHGVRGTVAHEPMSIAINKKIMIFFIGVNIILM